MKGRSIKQAVNLYADIAEPHNDQVGKEPEVGEKANQGKIPELVQPFKKEKGVQVRLREISMQQNHVPDYHNTITDRYTKEQGFDRRKTEQHQQYQAQNQSSCNGGQKGKENAAVVFDGGQVTHPVPSNNQFVKKDKA